MARGERKEDKKTIPEDLDIKTAVDTVLKTEAGRALWVWLFRRCGYNKSVLIVSRTTGDVAPLSVEARGAERDVYVDLRRLATPELRVVAEQIAEAIVKPQEEERKDA